MRLLLVDDSPLVRKLVISQLHGAARGVAATPPADVTEVSSVAEAHAALATGSPPSAALLDLELGDGTGLDVARQVLARAPGCALAFFSSAVSEPLLREARALGPVFSKPDQLSDAVRWVREATRATSSRSRTR